MLVLVAVSGIVFSGKTLNILIPYETVESPVFFSGKEISFPTYWVSFYFIFGGGSFHMQILLVT